ncbi:16_t:CDS:2, partial [Cetraspora pellucida]
LIEKTLANLYELLLELIKDLILIQENLNIDEDDIIAIQKDLGIVNYSNQERIKEADKTAKEYF